MLNRNYACANCAKVPMHVCHIVNQALLLHLAELVLQSVLLHTMPSAATALALLLCHVYPWLHVQDAAVTISSGHWKLSHAVSIVVSVLEQIIRISKCIPQQPARQQVQKLNICCNMFGAATPSHCTGRQTIYRRKWQDDFVQACHQGHLVLIKMPPVIICKTKSFQNLNSFSI